MILRQPGNRLARTALAWLVWCAALHAPCAPAPAAAQAADAFAAREAQVRTLIRNGQPEAAVEAARAAQAEVIAQAAGPAEVSRAYLLVILSYVNYGNFQSNERRTMAAETLHKEASTLIRELLSQPELRHTEIDRTSGEYPPEMIEMFDRVRSELFGALRILSVQPPDARILVDGEPLGMLPGETHRGDARLPAGPHTIVIEREGYEPVHESITITANSWQERPYQLEKKRSKKFYALVGAGVLAAAGGILALVAGGGSETAAESPLPGAPPPPAR